MSGLKFTPLILFVAAGLFAGVSGCDDEPAERPCPTQAGVICPWAGTGAPGFDGGGNTLRDSRFYWPVDVAFTSRGPYILDWNNHKVRHVGEDGRLSTAIGTDFVGDGPEDRSDQSAPGAPGTDIALNHPTQMLEMPDGRMLLVSWHNHKLRIWDPDTGLAYIACGQGGGFNGDGPVEDALLNQPQAARYAPDGSLYVLDQRNQRIRRITSLEAGGVIETMVGTGEPGFFGDGGSPLEAQVSFPTGSNPPPAGGLAFDDEGRLYFADTLNNRLRRVDFEADVIDTVIGDGSEEALNNPRDVEFGPDGRIYVADELNHRVLALDTDTLEIEVVAGTGTPGDSGDFGAATEAELNRPSGLAFDDEGNLYIADSYNHRIRLVRGAS